jgi:PucR C-terminal helix-turn-helix domain/GGDEF-like domain
VDELRGAQESWDAGAEAAGAVPVPWDALGPEVAAKLLPSVDVVVEDVLATVVERDVPREWVVGSPNARHGVEHGLRGLLQLIAAGPHAPLPDRGLYFGFGRGQLRAGRTLGALLAAYHHAARAALRALEQTGGGTELPRETLGALADAMLAYLAEISAASAEGFAFEQAARSPDLGERRRRLLAALVRAPGPPAAELRALAAAAGWRAGPPVAVIAFRHEHLQRVAARLPADALCARIDGVGYAVVPDPDGPARRSQLHARLRDVRAGLGPTVELAEAAESARWARLALTLAQEPALVVADEHRVDLLLLCAPALAAGLAQEALSPLAVLAPAARERLLSTLRVWLHHQGSVSATAAELHVHTQTVRYRVAQLRDLLGDRIDGAEGRLELQLALRSRRLPAPE